MDRPAHYTTYSAQLDALTDVELHDLAVTVGQLEDSPGWDALYRIARSAQSVELEVLEPSGTPPDRAMYAQAHGLVGGIDRVLGLPAAVRFAAAERFAAADAAIGERTAA